MTAFVDFILWYIKDSKYQMISNPNNLIADDTSNSEGEYNWKEIPSLTTAATNSISIIARNKAKNSTSILYKQQTLLLANLLMDGLQK